MAALALLALVLVAYFPAMRYGGFVWDDDANVTANPVVQGGTEGLVTIWSPLRRANDERAGAAAQYFPLTHTVFWLEHKLWGLNPAGYHAINVLLHAGAAILLWRVLRKLAVPGAWVAAALFAVHPVGVESVAWITELKNTLSGVFYLASLLVLLEFYLGEEDTPAAGPHAWPMYAAGGLLFLAALLAKTNTCALPAVLACVLWWKRPRMSRRLWLTLVPLLAAGLALAALAALREHRAVGATGADFAEPLVNRLLQATRTPWFYALKGLVPWPIVFIYPRWEISGSVWWQWLFPLLTLGTAAALWLMRQRIGRWPLAVYGAFLASVAPLGGVVQGYAFIFSYVADHWQYLALMCTVGVLGAGLGVLIQWRPRSGVVAACLVVGLFSAITFGECFNYENRTTLYGGIVAKNPAAWMAQSGLGVELVSQWRAGGGRHPELLDEAIAHDRAALALKPDNFDVQNNLGTALANRGDAAEAEAHFNQANLLITQRHTIRPDAYFNLALLQRKQGRRAEARANLEAAIAMSPRYSAALFMLGAMQAEDGKFAEASRQLVRALEVQPEWPEAWLLLGRAQAQLGRLREALTAFGQAVRLRPDWPEAQKDLEQARAAVERGGPAGGGRAPIEAH